MDIRCQHRAKSICKPAATATESTSTQCIVCKGNHHIWEYRELKEKSPIQRAKGVVEAKLCVTCLRESHMFWQCPNPKKCKKNRF